MRRGQTLTSPHAANAKVSVLRSLKCVSAEPAAVHRRRWGACTIYPLGEGCVRDRVAYLSQSRTPITQGSTEWNYIIGQPVVYL